MLELAGYYDGANVQLLEGGDIKKYQRVKIIVTNDFIDEYKVAYWEGIDEKYIHRERTRRACETLLSFPKPGIGSGDYKKDLIDRDKLICALKNESFKDFEDCLQMECGKMAKVDYIVTRDMKDFANSDIPCLTPDEVYAMFSSEQDEQR